MKKSGIGLLLLASSFAAYAGNDPSVLVKTEPVHQQSLVIGLAGYGIVTPDTGSTVNITFPRSGKIDRLSVMPGQVVTRGETLFVFVTDPVAANGYAQAKSSLEFARSEFLRINRLVRQQLATRSQLAAARKSLLDAESAVLEQRRLGAGIRKDRVKAPFNGIVTALFAARGDRIQPGKVVLQLARQNALRAQIGLQPEDLPRVKPGMPVQLHSVFDPALQVAGVVEKVHGMVDPQTQLVNVSVKIERNNNIALVPGMQVRAVIQVQTKSSWVVPGSAVLSDDSGSYIYQNDNGHARRVDVTELKDGAVSGISGKIDPGLSVVVLGNYELKDGMALREGAK